MPSSDGEKSVERKPGGLSNGSKHGLQGAQIRIKDEITQVAQEGKGFISPFPGQGARGSGRVQCSHIEREENAAVKPT